MVDGGDVEDRGDVEGGGLRDAGANFPSNPERVTDVSESNTRKMLLLLLVMGSGSDVPQNSPIEGYESSSPS